MGQLLGEQLPSIGRLFAEHEIDPMCFLLEWWLTLFVKAVGVEIASRIWDCVFFEGETFVFKTAMALLKVQAPMLETLDREELLVALTHIEEVDEDELFSAIDSIKIKQERLDELLRP